MVFSKLLITTAAIIIAPAINTLVGGISLKNNHPQIGPNILSVNINNPTVAAGVVLEPIVTKINPKASCGTPKRNERPKSFWDIIKFSDKIPKKFIIEIEF